MAEKTHSGRRLALEMRTRASAEEVWEAWTNPDDIARWFVDRARGKPEVGSTFTWIFEKFGYELPYEVVAAEPGRRFALGGEIPGRGPFLLEITIRKDGGETVVTLVNSGFLDGASWDEEYEGILSGWQNALATLKEYLENHRGLARSALLVIQPADSAYEKLLPFYATPRGLCRWLATSAEIGEVGDRCGLALSGGGTLTGRDLSKTAWEVALSWRELDAVLELKGFRFGTLGRVVGARVVGWGEAIQAATGLEGRLQAALERLAGVLREEASA